MHRDAPTGESGEMLKAIVDATTAVIYIKDVDGRYILINRRYENLFHVTNEESRGKTDHDLFPSDVADRLRRNDLDVQRAQVAVEFEEEVPHDDGAHTYISVKFPLMRPGGEVYAVCGISTDITSRKRAEAELEATKASLERLVDERTADVRGANERLKAEVAERIAAVERLQRLIDTAREGIWAIDAVGRTTFVNERLAEMFGYTPEEMLGRLFTDFMDEQDREEAARQLERRRRGIAEDVDFAFRRKDGSTVWALVATNPIRDRRGEMVGALAVLTDITERKRAERHQALLLRELDHRVKNTLATVLALSDLTLERATSVDEFRVAFRGRVQAMARTHEALSRARWQSVGLDEVAAVVMAPLASGDAARITMKGEPVLIAATAAAPLALALNELATNALKHGALSRHGGGVAMEWWGTDDGEVRCHWTERDGPPVAVPLTTGIGLRLIRGLIEHEIGGRVTFELPPEGLSCQIVIPAGGITGSID
jgi:PAS domain S-box-containing protein